MKIVRIFVAVTAILTLALGLVPAGAQEGQVAKSDNVSLIRHIQYEGGTELAARGRYLFSGEFNGRDNRDQNPKKGGIRIFRLSDSGVPRQVGFLRCPGNDNDIEVINRRLIVVAYHVNTCGNPATDDGMLVVDVSKKRRPKVIGKVAMPSGRAGSAHTLNPYPPIPGSKKRYVYINPGGLANGNSVEQIVDISNPRKPKIAASYGPADGGPESGCHDLSFSFSNGRKLGFCAGYQHVTIWDVSDPLKPEMVSQIRNPAIEFDHFALPSPDGKLLAIDDEAFAAHECASGQSPTGRVWIYDITNPETPVMQSSYAPPRGGDSTELGTYPGWIASWCLSHGLHWKRASNNLAVTWFTGGVSVLNLDDPTSPEEVAHYMAPTSATYSVLWKRGRLYTNDTYRGLEVFDVSGL